MEKIINAAVERGASDLHIKAGDVFRAHATEHLAQSPDVSTRVRAIALEAIVLEEELVHLQRRLSRRPRRLRAADARLEVAALFLA